MHPHVLPALLPKSTLLFAEILTRHILYTFLHRLDFETAKIICLTCESLKIDATSVESTVIYSITARKVNIHDFEHDDFKPNDTVRKLSRVSMPPNGLVFTAEWHTGYEPFGSAQLREAPTRYLINQLTGTRTLAATNHDAEFSQSNQINSDSGLSIWLIGDSIRAEDTDSIQGLLVVYELKHYL